ncbi:unnamed protein product, partial [Bemisia tabaci]
MNTSRIASKTVRLAACGQRKTLSAYKTFGILHALRQTQCSLRGAAVEVKIIKLHLSLFFH